MGEQNPLQNSVVLQKVFGYLKPTAKLETVKTLRQVCRVWRDESLDWWRKEAVLQVNSEKMAGVANEKQLLNLLKDPDLFYRLEDQPFQNLRLESFTVNLANAFEQGTEVSALWNLVAPHVKHLSLSNVEFLTFERKRLEYAAGMEHALMRFFGELLPSLESLVVDRITLDYQPVDFPEDGAFLDLELPNLVSLKGVDFDYFYFSNLPNLQTLSVRSCDSLVKMLTGTSASGSFSKQFTISSLKELELDIERHSNCSSRSLYSIYHLEFPALRRLKFNFKKPNKRDNCFKVLRILLEKFSQQLEVLEVFIVPFVGTLDAACRSFPYGPEMTNLTELRLWGKIVPNLGFLRWTPRLKVLHMDVLCVEKSKELLSRRWNWQLNVRYDHFGNVSKAGFIEAPLLGLEYLQITFLNLTDLEALRRWMPKLKTLRTDLVPGSISVICRNWPDLEHLVGLQGSDLRNEDIIGEAEGLSGLKHLKTFHYQQLCDNSHLTDAVVPVFLKMDQLTDLQVCVSKEFSSEAEKALKDCTGTKGVVRIIRNYTGNEEHVYWQCCEAMKFLRRLDIGEGVPSSSDQESSGHEYFGDDSESETD